MIEWTAATGPRWVTLLIPVTAVLLGYLVPGEHISPREIIGALVIGGRVLGLWRPRFRAAE